MLVPCEKTEICCCAGLSKVSKMIKIGIQVFILFNLNCRQCSLFDNALYMGASCMLWITALQWSSVQNALWARTVSSLSSFCCHIYHSLLMYLKENQCRWCFLTWSLHLCGSYDSFLVEEVTFLLERGQLQKRLPEGCVMSSKHFSRSLLMSVFTLKQWISFLKEVS